MWGLFKMTCKNALKNTIVDYDKSYTKFTSDWELYLFIPCDNFSQATHIEKHIKRMKSKTYIKNLKKYPNISKRLLEKYKST